MPGAMPEQRDLVLIGFRGCGKTTLGSDLAVSLGRPFLDLDRRIEQRSGLTILRWFAERGEPAFREVEAALLEEVLHETAGRVLAPGGGAVLKERSRQLLRARALVLYLRVDPRELISRLRPVAGERPALTALSFEDEILQLTRVRDPLYQQAAHEVLEIPPGEEPAATLQRILAVLQRRKDFR